MKLKIVFSIFLSLTLLHGVGQSDSLENILKDSLLDIQHQQGATILSQADSVHIADSLQQEDLKTQIANLEASDAVKKALLQGRLDSLKLAQIQENERVKRQVDSLRASTKGVPVVVFDDTLFYIYSKLGPYSPSERAKSISRKLEYLVNENLYDEKALKVHSGTESDDIMHGETILTSLTNRDAFG